MNKKQEEKVRKILTLLDQWTRHDVLFRTTPNHLDESTEQWNKAAKKEDEIRVLMYGTADPVKLKIKLGL